MKIRTALSMLVVVFFGILAGASFDEDGNLEAWVWLIIIATLVIFFFALISGRHEELKRKEKAKAESEARKLRKAEEEKAYNEWLNNYIETNGLPDKTIVIEPNNITGVIHVHEATEKIFMQGKHYDFKEIMSCTFNDNPTTIKGKITSTTKSKTGSTVGRAIVGDIIAGPAGAIIGGTTGKKTTEFHQENDRIIHDYTVIININSIAAPILRIHTGSDGKLANEIVGLMNVIISRN